jgi:transposase-like protein
MSTSYRTSRRWTEREARAALSALSSSGLSQSAFCAHEGLDPQRLRLWRRKFGEASSEPRFVEVRPRALERIEVVLRSGLVLRVAESMEPSALRRFVDALDDSPC